MDHSDDDHSFELVDSDDLRTEKTDQTDDESFELLGSEELNSALKDIVEVATADKLTENELEYSDPDSSGTPNTDELNFNDVEGVSDETSEEDPSESTYVGDISSKPAAVDKIDMIDDAEGISDGNSEESPFECNYCWDMSSEPTNVDKIYMDGRLHYLVTPCWEVDGITVCDFPANIKLKEDMKINDVAKHHILPFLPAKSLLRFRSVSKEWDQWIGHPFLAHKQSYFFRAISGFFFQTDYSHYFEALDKPAYGIPRPSLWFLPEEVKVKSSCNGLLLCHGLGWQNRYYVCNPANGEFHVLPAAEYYHGEKPNLVLAFEPSPLNFGAHYHVICAFEPFDDSPVLYFEIYSSETKTWRCSDCADIGISTLQDNGFYMNGVAYWLTSSGELLAYDVKNELCGVQPIPCEVKAEGILALMDDEIAYIQAYIPAFREDDQSQMCIIEIFGGVGMILKRRVAVDVEFVSRFYSTRCRVLLSLNNNVLIIYIAGMIYSFNIIDEKFEAMNTREKYHSEGLYFPYVNSLVSLPSSAA